MVLQRAPVLAIQVLTFCAFVLATPLSADARPAASPKSRGRCSRVSHGVPGPNARHDRQAVQPFGRGAVFRQRNYATNSPSNRARSRAARRKDREKAPRASCPKERPCRPVKVSSLQQPPPSAGALAVKGLTSQPSRRDNSWKKYMRPARRAGYVTLRSTGRRWEGYAVVKGNRLAAAGQLRFQTRALILGALAPKRASISGWFACS